jgi:phosphomannomutase/phosphoglucomutase
MSIFKACDIRGVYLDEISPALAADIGRGVGAILHGGAVLVGGDVRKSTPSLKKDLIGGLLESGCQVTDVGTLPTPAFYFAKKWLGIPGGVMVTASHNPAKYNGFKVAFGDWPVTETEIKRLETLVLTRRFTRNKTKGDLTRRDILPAYLRFINAKLTEIRRERSRCGQPTATIEPEVFKIVVDCGNGCYSKIAPGVFRDFGYDVVELFCEEDGRFPNREPNPALAPNLTALCHKVIDVKASLGVAFDGDGDRVVFVTDAGEVVANDKTIALLAQYLLQLRPCGKVVFDIKCSGLVPYEVKKAGGVPIMEKSGHAFIKTTLIKEKAVLGGEISGHFFFEQLGGDDGLFAGLLVADIIRESGGSISNVIKEFPSFNTTPDIRIPYLENDRETLLDTLAKSLEATGDCIVSRLDGVRGEFSGGWGLVRASVTEPLLTFRFESIEGHSINEIIERFLKPVPKLKALVDGNEVTP